MNRDVTSAGPPTVGPGSTADLPVPPEPVPPARPVPPATAGTVVEPATPVDESSTTGGTVREGARQVASSAAEHGQEVIGTAAERSRQLAADVRDRVTDQARNQNERLVSSLRQAADQLSQMATEKPDSPAQMVVQRLGETSQQAADYLERYGPDGAIREVQEFARRRPGLFLLGAVVAGFAVGRLGKSVLSASHESGNGSRQPDLAPQADLRADPRTELRNSNVDTVPIATPPAPGGVR